MPQQLAQGDYAGDPAVREAFAQWVQQLWLEKDAQIALLLSQRKSTNAR